MNYATANPKLKLYILDINCLVVRTYMF